MKKIQPKALLKVPLAVDFEIGRVQRNIEEVLQFSKGTVLKLEKSEKDVIQLYINGEQFADGKAMRKNGFMFVQLMEIKKQKGE